MPDWTLHNWHTGRKMTLLQAFGISDEKFHYPRLFPVLTTQASHHQRPLNISGPTTGAAHPQGGPGKQQGPVRQYARKLLRDNKWGGQWVSFNSLVLAESGWNPNIKESTWINGNPPTYAFGIAQALNHGNGSATQGTESNMYGGFGLTDKQAKAANSGDPYWQLVWMMNYIKQTYGSPDKAWAFHQAHGWY